jgi:hypothetical protein
VTEGDAICAVLVLSFRNRRRARNMCVLFWEIGRWPLRSNLCHLLRVISRIFVFFKVCDLIAVSLTKECPLRSLD